MNLRRDLRRFLNCFRDVFYRLFGSRLALRHYNTTTATAAAATTPAASAGLVESLEVSLFLLGDGLVLGSGRGRIRGLRNILDYKMAVTGRAFRPWFQLLFRFLLGLLCSACVASVLGAGVANFKGRLVGAADRGLFHFVGFFLIVKLHEVAYVEEGITFKAYIYKS
jgi:hypothetical protein